MAGSGGARNLRLGMPNAQKIEANIQYDGRYVIMAIIFNKSIVMMKT
jgi:hypothetical protein